MGLTSFRKIFLALVAVFVAGCATDAQRSVFRRYQSLIFSRLS